MQKSDISLASLTTTQNYNKMIKVTAPLTTTSVKVGRHSITVKHGSRLTSADILYYAEKWYNNGSIDTDLSGKQIPFLVWLKKNYGWNLAPFAI